MKQRGMKEWVIRAVILMIGLTIAHLGVTLFLLSDMGADSFNVFVQGLFHKISALTPPGVLTHGRTHMIVSLFISIVLLLVDRSYIKIGTVLCMVCGGPIIDFFTWILGFILPENLSVIARILMLVLGCVILAYGMTIVIKSDAGTGPHDLVAVVISDKTRRRFSIIRLIVDAVFAIVGYVLGGTIGIGTIVCVMLVGAVAGFFLPVNEKMIEGFVKKQVR